MRRVQLALLLGMGLSLAVTAGADPMYLKVGAAKTDGTVSFTLHYTPTGESYAVQAYVPLSVDKAQTVAAAVAAADPTGTWQGTASGTQLSFQHLVDGVWGAVDTITDLVDTTGAGSKLSTTGNVVDFVLNIAPDASATGVDATDAPSFVSVSLTDTLTWTQAIQPGQTAADLLDGFQAFLQSEAGEGVLVTRLSPNELKATLLYDSSQMNWEITDTGLQPAAKGAGVSTDQPAGLIDRRRK